MSAFVPWNIYVYSYKRNRSIGVCIHQHGYDSWSNGWRFVYTVNKHSMLRVVRSKKTYAAGAYRDFVEYVKFNV